MTGSETLQVRRARERQDAQPKRFFATHPKRTRAQRNALGRKTRNPMRAHPTKSRAPMSFRRVIAQRLMAWVFAAAAAPAGILAGDVGAVV